MKLRSYVQEFLRAYPSNLYSTSGEVFDRAKIARDYGKIKEFLGTHESGDLVAIDLPKDVHYFLTILCCLEIGMPFVPLRKEWPEARKLQIQGISHFKTRLDEEKLKSILSSQSSRPIADFPVSESSPAYVMFTSGTTGEPKGVEISRAALENYFEWIRTEQNLITPDDRVLNTTDFTFDVSFADVGILLTKHPHVYMSDFRNDLFRMLNEMDKFKITVHCTTPNNYSILLSDRFVSRADVSHLKLALVCGSRFSANLFEVFRKAAPQTTVYNCYGPTENTVYCICKKMVGALGQNSKNGNVSVGFPLPGTGAIIVGPDSSPLKAFEEGELLLSGRQLMTSYRNNPAETEKRICSVGGASYYRSGDVAYQDEKGEFYITGRVDDEVKINSQRANLSDIECYILTLPYVQLCSVIAIPHEIKGVSLVLYAQFKSKTDQKIVFEDLDRILLKHQIPQEIIAVDELPRNNSGKICKKTLKSWYTEKRHVQS